MVASRVFPRTTLADSFVHSPSNFQSFNSLRPLEISCLSFFDRRPLFSRACSLFFRNAGGGIPRSPRSLRQLRARRLPRPGRGVSALSFSSIFSRHWPLSVARHASLATRHFLLSTFRINTCKSATKQTTSTPFKITTCEKHREGEGYR
jgi:hypothetical protein